MGTPPLPPPATPKRPAPLPPGAAWTEVLRGLLRGARPSLAARLPVRPRLGPARPPADGRPAKRKRSGVSGGLMAPPQMRRPNVSTEAVGSWSSKATTKKFQSKEREKLSRR